MKKLLVGLIVLFSLALMGCPQSERPVTAYFKIYNTSDTYYYVMLDYNKSMDGTDRASWMKPRTSVLRTSRDGKYLQSKIDQQGDEIILYYCQEDDWENLRDNVYNGYTNYWIVTQSGESCIQKKEITGYKSRYYTITITNSGIDVEPEWED